MEKVSFMQCMSVFVPISAVAMINKNFNSKRMPRLATPFRAVVVLPRCIYRQGMARLFSLLIFFWYFLLSAFLFFVPSGTPNDLFRRMLLREISFLLNKFRPNICIYQKKAVLLQSKSAKFNKQKDMI